MVGARLRPAGALLVLALSVSGCGADREQARVCEAAIGAFVSEPVEVLEAMADEPPYAVRLRYRTTRSADERIISCGFAGSAGPERFRLAAIRTEAGPLTAMQLFWLHRWLALERGLPPETSGRASAETPDAVPRALVYALQQGLNALTLACVYGLLAVGFTLVYGITGRIIFAFGEIAMLGAVAVVLWAGALDRYGAGSLVLLAGLGMIAAGAHGWAADRVVFRAIGRRSPQAALIAAIGLAVFIQEYVRLVQTDNDLWLAPRLAGRVVLVAQPGFPVVVSAAQAMVAGLSLAVAAGLAILIGRSRFGLEYRACAADPVMSGLLGIDAARRTTQSFALAGCCAGLAGWIVVTYYGVANFSMGFLLGFKALVAAILGGIGSIPGAFLGAAMLAAIEVFWSGYSEMAYKDVAAFALLALVLALRSNPRRLGEP